MNTIQTLLAVYFGLCASFAYADYKDADEARRSNNYARVLQACQADAERGEKNCQSHLGNLYKYGSGVEKNLPLSVEWLKKSASQGQMYAEEMLGDSYANGLGVTRDYEEALRLFKSSAGKGNPWAFNNLGNIYRNGRVVKRDPAEALRFFRIAAEKGNPAAQSNLADMYRLGDGVERNADEAFQWALKSSKQNHGLGWSQLGLLYRDGVGVRQDTAKAIEAFKQATQLRNPPSSFARTAFSNLANIYWGGIGVAVNPNEAARWAEEGVKLDEPGAMVLMAYILRNGGGDIKPDPQRAFELANRASAMGAVTGKTALGVFYRDGVGTPADPEYGMKLLLQARDAGAFDALVEIGKSHLDGKGVAKDEGKAREYFAMAQAKADRLGPRNRAFVQAYFTRAATAPKPAHAAAPPVAGSAPPPLSVAATNTAPPLDKSQRELLERLDQLQRQLEALQATANTSSVQQELPKPKMVMAARRALVIGNDKYQHVSTLQNAREDARAIAKTLETLGYTVFLHLDLNEKGFKQALRDFRARLDGGEEVLVFYAGHGVQLGSANYLLPVDIKGDSEEQVKDEGIELQRVLDDLKDRKTKFALAIIDACRDNPFKSSGRALGGRGLAPTTAATGQMVMFSAGAGQQALDKLGQKDPDKNGLFTRVLLKEMIKPQVTVDRVLRNVRNEVVQMSKSVGHEQTPALYDQAVGDFYFKY